MNIAICDDNIKESGMLEETIYSCFHKNMICDCDVYTSGEELIKFLDNQKKVYQIYFLDIEMGKIDGFEVANFIRNRFENAIIIFTTCHSEWVYDAFEVNAFHYLVKPINKESVEKVLIRARKFLELKNTLFQFKIGKVIHTLNYNQIIYFESKGRQIIIYSIDENFVYYETLKKMMLRLKRTLFAQIHNSYVVNMEYISKIENHNVFLQNKIVLNISRKYYSEFMNKYKEFILEKAR